MKKKIRKKLLTNKQLEQKSQDEKDEYIKSSRKEKPFNVKAFAIASLRRSSYRYPPREQARRLAKVDRNQYKCAKCNNIFKRKDTKIDHIEPVVSPYTGWVSFDSFIERLFCPVEGFQVLCKTDHDKKTKEEGVIRKTQRLLDTSKKK